MDRRQITQFLRGAPPDTAFCPSLPPNGSDAIVKSHVPDANTVPNEHLRDTKRALLGAQLLPCRLEVSLRVHVLWISSCWLVGFTHFLRIYVLSAGKVSEKESDPPSEAYQFSRLDLIE